MTERRSDDSIRVSRAVEEIEGASVLFAAIFVLGPVWSLVVALAGWGFLTWAPGAAICCFLLFRSVQNIQSLRSLNLLIVTLPIHSSVMFFRQMVRRFCKNGDLLLRNKLF